MHTFHLLGSVNGLYTQLYITLGIKNMLVCNFRHSGMSLSYPGFSVSCVYERPHSESHSKNNT